MLTTVAATFAAVCAVIVLARTHHLSVDPSLARDLGLLLGAASVCMALRAPALVQVTGHLGLGPVSELVKHTLGAVALGLFPMEIFPTGRGLRRWGVSLVALGAAVMVATFAVTAPSGAEDLDATLADSRMVPYWGVLWLFVVTGAGVGLVGMILHIRTRGFGFVHVAIAATCAGMLAWGLSGTHDWLAALTGAGTTRVRSSGTPGENDWATIAVATIALGLGAALAMALARVRRRRADLTALIDHVRLRPLDTDRTQRLLIVAQDHLSLLQDFAEPPDEEDASSPAARIAIIDRALDRARLGKLPGRTTTWDWAGADSVLLALGHHCRTLAPRPHRLARAWSALTQPVVAIPVVAALLGAVDGGSLAWAICLSLAVAAPILLMFAARIVGWLPTMRLTGRPRVVLLSTGISWEVVVVAGLHIAGAPPALAHTVLALIAGAVALAGVSAVTDISAHTSIWAMLAGCLIPQHPLMAAAAAVIAASCAAARIRVGAHTPLQALALPWIPAVASLLTQLG